MITIIKGDSKLVVSARTFEEQYKNLGYQIASNDKEATKPVASIVKEKENEEDIKKDEKKEEIAKKDNEEEKISKKYGFKGKTKKGK